MTKHRGIFISYATIDGESFARDLRQRLKQCAPELYVWRDREELVAGKRWWPQIEQTLLSVDCMVLLLSPGALDSPYTTREWQFCRQNAIPVIPVIVPGLPFPKHAVPAWMRAIHWHSLDEDDGWSRFTSLVRSPHPAERIPMMAPDLPDNYVHREREYGQLLDRVLNAELGRPVAVSALHGAGGFGKTTLAARLCRDQRVATEFVDGILWVTLGENPDVLRELSSLYAVLTGERPGFQTEFEAATKLSMHLEHRRCLLVIDDVWDLSHVQPFLRGAPLCTRLITTRQINIAVASRCETPVLVDVMKPAEAMALLGEYTPPEHHTVLEQMARRLGEWPLMLELARGTIRKLTLPPRNKTFADALQHVNQLLEDRGVNGLELYNNSSRQASISATMDISLSHLSAGDRESAFQLSVFGADLNIPFSALKALWNVPEFEVGSRVERLSDSSIVRFQSEDGSIRIHDVVREYLASKLREPELTHRGLVDRWGHSHQLGDPFAWDWYGYHLIAAGAVQRLTELVMDPTWLEAKLSATGPHSLIVETERLAQNLDLKGKSDDTATAVAMLRDAIRLSSHVATRDPDQFSCQVIGRMTSAISESPSIARFAERINSSRVLPCLLPQTDILSQVGGPLVRTLQGHRSEVTCICTTEDGRFAVSASKDGSLIVWDLRSGRNALEVRIHEEPVKTLVLTRDGRVVSGAEDGTIAIWDIQTGAVEQIICAHSDATTRLILTRKCDYIISSSLDATIRIWDRLTGESVKVLRGHADAVNDICLSTDERHLISASSDRSLMVWDLPWGQMLRTLEGHTAAVTTVATSRKVPRLVSAGADRTIRLWDLPTGIQLRKIDCRGEHVQCLALSTCDQFVFSGSSEGTLTSWNLDTAQRIRTVDHGGAVNSVCIVNCANQSPPELYLSGAADSTLKLWNLEAQLSEPLPSAHRNLISSICVATNSNQVVTASYDRSVKIWSLEDRGICRTLTHHSGWVNCVRITPDGKYIVSTSNDHTIKILDVFSGAVLATLRDYDAYNVSVSCVAVASTHFLSGAHDGILRVWQLSNFEMLRTLGGHSGGITCAAIHASEPLAITGSCDRSLMVWNWQTGKHILTLLGHTAEVNDVAFVPGTERAASVANDGTLRIWDLQTGKSEKSLVGHTGPVTCIQVSSDGRFAFTTSTDKSLRIWDLKGAKPLTVFWAEHPLTSCAITNDLRTVFIGDSEGRLNSLAFIAIGS